MTEFATITDLMPHQHPAVAKMLPSRVGALFMDMGTGKSRTLIELARLRQHKWDRLFWFTPCALRDNVRDQLLTHTNLPPESIAVWRAGRLRRAEIERARVHVVGIESMSSANSVIFAYNDLCTPSSFVAVDESEYIKGNRAKRTQRITHMSARARYRAILTGTPFTQGAVDLYSQMQFLSPKILGYRSFWAFANNHLQFEERMDERGRLRRTGRVVRTFNSEYLAARIAPYVYQVRKDECIDLPSKLYDGVRFSMTEEQRDLYERAKNELLEVSYIEWQPFHIYRLFTSLQTIVCGFWHRTPGELLTARHRRVDVLLATLAQIPPGEQVVIWAKYRYAVEQITEALSETYGADQVCPYHGDISESARAAHMERWRAGARFLVATQSIGGHGLTLNEAAYMVFYADGFKYAERVQAEDRNHRIGQTRRPVYITLECMDSIDERVHKALRRKEDALWSFQKQVDRYRSEKLRQSAIQLVRSL
ncbi:MAG: DEAD/DEAH box helicase [Thauera sp.]|nr:DEAD/DEAH box helicase [Thauera sp.]